MSANTYKKQKVHTLSAAPATEELQQRTEECQPQCKVHYLRIQSLMKETHNIYSQPLTYRYPVLRLWGKWLETAGFPAGSRVSVTVTDKQMGIRKIEEEG